MDSRILGIHLLRLSLAAMFLWFGFSQLLDGLNWVDWVPEWAVTLLNMPPALIVLLNGTAEVVGGVLLATGVFVRPVAILLGIHLAIITVDIGMNAIGVRDFALTCATLALALLAGKERKPEVTK